MKKDLRQLVENSSQAGTPCEKVLGSTPKVDKVASLLTNHASILRLIATNAILEYIEGDVSKDEITAFKAGVGAFGDFMTDCVKEREARRQKSEPEEE